MYAVEPIAAQGTGGRCSPCGAQPHSAVRQYIARRLAEDLSTRPAPVEALLQTAGDVDAAAQLDILRGLAESLHGWRKAPKPAAWEPLRVGIIGSLPTKEAVEKLGGTSRELIT